MKTRALIALLLLQLPLFANASDMEKFSEILGWEESWNRVVDRSVDGYWDRAVSSYLDYLTDEQKAKAMPLVKGSLKDRLAWTDVKPIYLENFRESCGEENIESAIAVIAGEPYDEQEKESIVSTYMSCTKEATGKIVEILLNRIEGFSEVEREIVKSIE